MSKLLPVTKEVIDYTKEELEQFYEQFAPVAQRIHHLYRLSFIFIALIFGNILIIPIVTVAMTKGIIPEWIPAIIPLVILCIFSGLVLFFLVCLLVSNQRRFCLDKCPACHNSFLQRQLRTYCPECGSSQLDAYQHCIECSKSWGPHKFRYCTHCGVFLDEKGFRL